MSRPAFAHVDLNALRHNYQLARSRHGGRALAVIKANAYGHGAVPCARALAPEADGFAVAVVEEAVALREAGIGGPILVLEGAFGADDLARAEAFDLWLVVHHRDQVFLFEQHPPTRPVPVWLKMDSGMHRAGFAPGHFAAAHEKLASLPGVGEITLMTHFARADEPDELATARQVRTFDDATAQLPGARSLCNSGGILGWPRAHRDWSRPGIMLYGADPMPAEGHGLEPVMTLGSAIIGVRELPAGEAIGYGGRFVTERPTRIGLVAMGYADGYPRTAPDGTPVAVDGALTRLIGRVSMDMLMVDLTELPAAGMGAPVELWGRTVPVNTVARAAGTIAYELLCNVKRVGFRHADGPPA
ncbi:alanine racemase [Nitrogeniibacter mangrovi]|uniref:Alanine racemase n=1 Tax=Nitrogeniibacter mangrovi TaxID=2016596 RepID=A0A6C1BA30_9RHOO|nr:alanine racemase [Nitrogeniibacter mangrovi]QID19230.1 alanine racemase [Nitrogeniibacter mangrovi]